jgi:hypothetical protein
MWVVLVAVHVLAFFWVMVAGRWDFPDSGRYVQAAENLWRYRELYARAWPAELPHGQAVQEFTIRPVGYPLVVLGLGVVAWGPVLLLLLQNILSLFNLGLVLVWWANWAQPKATNWWWAVVGILSFPAQFIYANAVMSETLLQTVVLGMTVAGFLFIRTGKRKYLVGVAGAAVAALFLKPVFYPLAVVIGALGVWMAWRFRQVNLLLIGMIPLLAVGLYMEWNWQRTGYFHFSSIAEINVLHYNAAGVVRQVAGPAAEEKWVADVLREANAQPIFFARQQVIQARAGAVLRTHPMVYVRQHLQGMVAMFLDPGRFDISQFLGLKAPAGGGFLLQVRTGGILQALGRMPLGLLGVLGLVLGANVVRLVLAVRGFWRLKHREPMLRYGRWGAVGLLLYVAALTGPLGAARFLVPLWPLLLGLALVGLQQADKPTGGAEAGASA